jgi:hypothetical protein
MIATHMNAPYGPVVTPDDVVASLRRGAFCAATDDANAILAAMFVECSRSLIERAGAELGVPAERLQALYRESLRMGLMPVQEWTTAPAMTDTTHSPPSPENERTQELVELVRIIVSNNPGKAMPAGFDAAGWIAEWVCEKHPRLNGDRPIDLFDSQDGFEEVQSLVRRTIMATLQPRDPS